MKYTLNIYLFIWVLMSLSLHCIGHITTGSFIHLFIYLGFNITFNTLCRSYHDGYIYGQRKPVHTVGQGSVL